MLKQEVVEFFGSCAAVGSAIGITGQAVSQWGDEVPATRVRSVEMAVKEELERRKRAERSARTQAKRLEKQRERGNAHVV